MADNDIDAEISRWAEKIFYSVSLKGKVPRQDRTSKKLGATAAKAISRHARIRAQIARTTRLSPEVMVKITNRLGAGKGMGAIRNHLTYISRNGKLVLETDTGENLSDREAVEDYALELKNQIRGKQIPEVSHRREAFNIILSMPAGTPAESVRAAAKNFLEEEFSGKHRYCFTLHTDTDKPHVHVCVLAAPLYKRKRLNPRKADLQRWREGFAEQLREIGIDANATPWRARGVLSKPLAQSRHHERKRHPMGFKVVTQAIGWPYIYKGALDAWQKMGRALSNSPNQSDQHTGKLIQQFISGQTPDPSRKR